MATVVVLRDIEARADGAELRAALAGLAPRRVTVDFGRSGVGRAVLALPALEAALSRFASASVEVRGTTDVVELLEAHLGRRLSSGPGRSELLLDFRPGNRRKSEWKPGEPPCLSFAAAPYPSRHQHASQHWVDGARVAGLEPTEGAPVLGVPRSATAAARRLLSRLALRSPAVLLISNGRPESARELLAELGRTLAERIGARVLSLGRELSGIPAFPIASASVRAAACALSCLTIGDAGGWCHVAAAVGAPTLALHGRSDPVRQGPACEIGASAYAPCQKPSLHQPSLARASRCTKCLDHDEVAKLAEELAARRFPWDWLARFGARRVGGERR